MRFIVNLILTSVILSSCQKNNNVPAQPDKVTVNIISPAANQQYKKGDTLQLKAEVSYISQLHGYQVRVINAANGTVVYDLDGHNHSDKFSIDEKWVDTFSAAAELKVQFIAIIDHDKNTTTQEVQILSQP